MNYTPLDQTAICNLALQKVECLPIDSIDNQNDQKARLCKVAFWQAVREVGRLHDWNCLKKRAELALLTGQVVGTITTTQTGGAPAVINNWLPNTAYTTNDWVVFNGAAYTCAVSHTSSTGFVNDVYAGDWIQQFGYPQPVVGNAGDMYEWKYAYGMPGDYLLLVELNGNDCLWGRGVGSLYEIYASQMQANLSSHVLSLYCNEPTAVVKYVALIEDTTIYDPLFVGAVATFLASKVVTPIKKDGSAMEAKLLEEFYQVTLPQAMLRDGGERKERRYDPTKSSNFLRARQRGLVG